MAVQYDPDQLKAIGMQCSNKLPPASAVQAMFLYEMQRQSQAEALFEGQMFRLARQEDETKTHETRLWDLENQIKDMQKKVAAKDIDERLYTSKVRTDALGSKLKDQIERLDSQEQRLKAAETSLDALTSDQKTEKPNNEVADLKASFTAQDNDIQTLFDERDALVTLLNKANGRIDKLEDLVRALTLQKSPSTTSASAASSPKQVQFLPVANKDKENVELAVPKGSAFKPVIREGKEVKTFVPGAQWS